MVHGSWLVAHSHEKIAARGPGLGPIFAARNPMSLEPSGSSLELMSPMKRRINSEELGRARKTLGCAKTCK